MHAWRIAPVVALALTGCGGSDGGGATAPAVADWKASDACALVDRGAIGTLLRSPVESAELSMVSAGVPQDTSRCVIGLADGRKVTMVAFRSSNGADASSRDARRDWTRATAGKAPVDVPGLGAAAFWSPTSRELWTFFDDDRSLQLSINQYPRGGSGKRLPDATLKADAIALARKAGGA